MSKKVAVYGMLIALAFIFSYIEALIPFSVVVGIPGIKIGLANLVTLVALYTLKMKDAFVVSVLRIILVGFTFGNVSMMLYSLSGGILSFILMAVCIKWSGLSKIGISIVGGVSHNLGQLLMAMAMLSHTNLLYYFPVLMISGTIAGIVIGIMGGLVMKRLPKFEK